MLILVLIYSASCKTNSQKNQSQAAGERFDKVRWQLTDGRDYLYRDAMLKNLMSDSAIRRLKRDQLINILGTAEKTDNNFLFYRVDQTRLGVMPLHTKTLVIKFRADSSVEWMKIHE